MRPTRVRIHSAVLSENLTRLKRKNGAAFFCPMIKANAYGHGVREVAPIVDAAGVDAAGVALIEEGVELRRLGFRSPILVFAPLEPGDASVLAECGLTPVVGRFQDLAELEKYRGDKIDVHLKFNTGMQRLGFDEPQCAELKARIQSSGRFRVTGVCTHFTHGEDAGSPDGPTAHQFARFLKLAEGFPGVRHAHKSATLAAPDKLHAEVGARPGISIYGLPFEEGHVAAGLKPALSWHTRLSHVHEIGRGESVSYGGRWTASRRSTIGVVPLGYGDGYFRSLSDKGVMIFRAMKVPVVGTVCMDYVLLDLTEACREGVAQPGEEIVVLGGQNGSEITAWDLAQAAGTIAYEVVTRISARVAREVV